MAIAEAQAWVGASAGAGGTVTATYGSTPTQGNLLIACGRGTNPFSNATLSGWTLAVQSFSTSGGSPIAIWYKIAGAAEPTAVTLLWTSSANINLSIGEYSGMLAAPLDKTGTNPSDGITSLSKSSGTITSPTVYPYELCIAFIGMAGGLGTITYGDGFTLRNAPATAVSFVASKVVYQKGSYSFGCTHTSTRIGGGVIATFAGKDQHGLLGVL
jgi:hypothetical protein